MGTGAFANIYQLLSGGTSGVLHGIAVMLLLLAVGVFCASLVFMGFRLVAGLDCMLKEWRHSSLIQFYSAISIAAAVCATGLMNIPVQFVSSKTVGFLAAVFWWIALIDGLFFVFFGPIKVTIGSHAQPRRALGFWFLAPVGLFVLVFAGNFRAMHMSDTGDIRTMLFLNTLILGVAICLTVIFYTIILFRALFYNFPRRDVAPSFMIGVAPVGVSIVAVNTLIPVLKKSGLQIIDPELVASLVKVFSVMLWGFGLWWLVYSLIIVVYYFYKKGIPVTLGYWAFIFPPAAYTLASLLLAKSLGVPLFKVVAVALTLVFSIWWLVNVVLTVRGMFTKRIFDVAPTFKGDIPYL